MIQEGVSRAWLESAIAGSFFRAVLDGELLAWSGHCALRIVPRPAHRQHLGAVHGGIVGALADDACAWACASVAGNLVTASYTLNLLGPAIGEMLVAEGSVVKTGRRLVVVRADV
jgi:uncharacterized protein (TIGR00369 family)